MNRHPGQRAWCVRIIPRPQARQLAQPSRDLLIDRRPPPAEHGQFDSEPDLAEQVLAFIEHYNVTAKPFAWTYAGKPLAAWYGHVAAIDLTVLPGEIPGLSGWRVASIPKIPREKHGPQQETRQKPRPKRVCSAVRLGVTRISPLAPVIVRRVVCHPKGGDEDN